LTIKGQDNLLPDPGFEESTISNISGTNSNFFNINGVTVWRGFPFTGFDLIDSPVKTGNQALKVKYFNYGSGTPSFRSELYPTLDAGKYEFSFWVKTDIDRSAFTLSLSFISGKVGSPSTSIPEGSITFNIPENAQNEYVQFKHIFEISQQYIDVRPAISISYIANDGDFILFDDIVWRNIPNTSQALNPDPSTGTTINSFSPLLKWESASSSLKDNLYFGTDAENLALIGENITSNQYQLDNLNYETTYYWRIDGEDALSNIISGDIWNFTTSNPSVTFFNSLQSQAINSDEYIRWQQLGPGNAGYCNFVRFHPTEEKVVFNVPDMGNAYRSVDLCRSWHTVRSFENNSTWDDLYRPNEVEFSLQDGNLGMAINRYGRLLSTNDMGKSWNRHNYSFDNAELCALAVDPNDDNYWFTGSGRAGRGQVLNSMHLTAHSENPAGDNISEKPGNIWRSSNKGITWEKTNSGIPSNAQISRIIVHPTNSNIIFAATTHGVFKSNDKGGNWTQIGKNTLPNNIIIDMDSYYSPSTGLVLYLIDRVVYAANGSTLTSSGGVFKSFDEGETWQDVNAGLRMDLNKTTSNNVSSLFFQYISNWFKLSGEAEARNKYSLPNDALHNFTTLQIDPSNPNRIYVGYHIMNRAYGFPPGILWKSEDGGNSWISCARYGERYEKDATFWNSINPEQPLNANMDIGHSGGDALKYNESEKTYPQCGLRSLTINKNGDLVIIHGHHTYLSTDHATTWKQVDDECINTDANSLADKYWVGKGDSNVPGKNVYMDSRWPDRYFFACGEHGMFINKPGGDELYLNAYAMDWLEKAPQTISAFAVDPDNKNTMFSLVNRLDGAGKFWKSTDGGANWTAIGDAPVKNISDRVAFNSLNIDPIDNNVIYFGMSVTLPYDYAQPDETDRNGNFIIKGVYKTTDGGNTWFKGLNYGLPGGDNANVIGLTMDNEDNNTLYAALLKNGGLNGGLYKTTDGAATWNKVTSLPSGVIDVTNVIINNTSGTLYVTAGSASAQTDEGGAWISQDKGVTWKKIFHMPYVSQIAFDPNNAERIMVAIRPNNNINFSNSGIYLTEDNGNSWKKINYGIGNPYDITDIKFDLTDGNILWCAVQSSGWYRAIIKKEAIAHTNYDLVVTEGDEVTLNASQSLGSGINYLWESLDNITISDFDQPLASFTAPEVDEEMIIKFKLTVTSGSETDVTMVRVYVQNTVDTSIKSQRKKHTLNIFPNPCNSILKINIINSSDPIKKITIYDIKGETIDEYNYSNYTLNVSNLPSGYYLIKVLFSSNIFETYKILKN